MPSKNVCQEISLEKEILLNYDDLVKQLREIWGQRGFKQITLATKAGVNPTSLNKFINKGIVPTFDNMYRLMYAYLGRPPIHLHCSVQTDIYKETVLQIAQLLAKLPL